jgi:hypothetical protein
MMAAWLAVPLIRDRRMLWLFSGPGTVGEDDHPND